MADEPAQTYAATLASFDDRAVAAMPEWRAARDALDALVHAINRDPAKLAAVAVPPGSGSLAGWLGLVQRLALHLPYSDACSDCTRLDGYVGRNSHSPVAGRVEDGWLTGMYTCERGHVWRCGYSAAYPDHGWV